MNQAEEQETIINPTKEEVKYSRGSSWGSSSSDFYIYRAQRRKEIQRQQAMEAEDAERDQCEQIYSKLSSANQLLANNTEKNRQKRQKKADKAKNHRVTNGSQFEKRDSDLAEIDESVEKFFEDYS